MKPIAFLSTIFCFALMPCMVANAQPKTIRFASFNVSFHRKAAGDLVKDLTTTDHPNAKRIAEIIQRTNPDVILLNEFDFDAPLEAADLFKRHYLEVAQNGQEPIRFAYHYSAPVNTGEPSGIDLDGDGKLGSPNDAFGYGVYPGQYGMLVLSKFPIQESAVRSFQKFLWNRMPDAEIPIREDGQPFYSKASWDIFRLSSKSHWDVPIEVNDQMVHFLVCHPTPPVFDGPEDRNGRRNHDEIRLWADYISPAKSRYLIDDQGKAGGLAANAKFVIAGDLNADPNDGDSSDRAILQLLEHPLVDASMIPLSEGAKQAATDQGGVNGTHKGDPSQDTSDFGDRGRSSGNLRIDYVLPSKSLKAKKAGVFWPTKEDPAFELISATDHRLVWIDLIVE